MQRVRKASCLSCSVGGTWDSLQSSFLWCRRGAFTKRRGRTVSLGFGAVQRWVWRWSAHVSGALCWVSEGVFKRKGMGPYTDGEGGEFDGGHGEMEEG